MKDKAGLCPDPPKGSRPVETVSVRNGVSRKSARTVAEEIAVALTYDGATHAVMMASPCDLEDFALGFSLTEGIVASPAEIESIEPVPVEHGIDLRILLREDRGIALSERRRRLAGPVGCGLCGIESLAQAMRDTIPVRCDFSVTHQAIFEAISALPVAQTLNRATGAVHAAAFWAPGTDLLLREDVGRHNALDKLAGALARATRSPAQGLLVLTSRLSIELVQKAAMIGAGILVAISAPTALAIETADAAGITLVGIARADGFEVFTHPSRIAADEVTHAA
jgi:FdhD protein